MPGKRTCLSRTSAYRSKRAWNGLLLRGILKEFQCPEALPTVEQEADTTVDDLLGDLLAVEAETEERPKEPARVGASRGHWHGSWHGRSAWAQGERSSLLIRSTHPHVYLRGNRAPPHRF